MPHNYHAYVCVPVPARRVKAEIIQLSTADGRQVEAFWTSRQFDSTGPSEGTAASNRGVVILFHANAQIGLDLCEWARWYRNRNIDALVVTMGGYAGTSAPRSEGPASEAHGYLDAQASIERGFVKGNE